MSPGGDKKRFCCVARYLEWWLESAPEAKWYAAGPREKGALVRVPEVVRGRVHHHRVVLAADLGPDCGLVGAVLVVAPQPVQDHRRLEAPQRRRAVVPGRERARPVGPPALLDAAHGDLYLRARRDEDGRVEDAVLLDARELLAVDEEDALVGAVDDLELGDAALFARLEDLHLALPGRFVESGVADLCLGGRGDEEDRQVLVAGGLADGG